MDWLRVTVHCEAAALDAVCACLSQAGAPEQEIVDDWDSIRAELEESKQYWDYVDKDELMANKPGICVRVYVSDDEAGRGKLEQISVAIDKLVAVHSAASMNEIAFSPEKIRLETEIVKEEDWANTWKQFYKPIPIGERLIIVPEWEDFQDDSRAKLLMEPGLVFGTGEHQSTQLCLSALESLDINGSETLDLGCGSGILSIAALLLGAKNAVAVDIDPNAMGTARENARRNGIPDDIYEIAIGDILEERNLQARISRKQYDLIFANIVADVIIALLLQVKSCLKHGGQFICSGIISERFDDVKTALSKNELEISQCLRKDDWVCVRVEHS